MLRPHTRSSSAHLGALLATAAFSCAALFTISRAAQPFNTATITKIENKVSYGERQAGRSVTRPAAVADIIRANNFLLSDLNSRAEIQYPDGSLVRIGQNTVFSFDADTRTLSLDRGSLIFHIPKGSGGGIIKTPSLTAAITGTTGKVSAGERTKVGRPAPSIFAIIEGVVKLVPSGRLVHGGEFARLNPDGSITIAPFDPATTNEGRLVYFPDLMPGFQPRQQQTASLPTFDTRYLEVQQRANNLPGTFARDAFDRNRNRIFVPPPKKDQPNRNPGAY